MAGTAELLKAFEAHSTAVALLQLQHEDEHLALDAQQVKQRRDLCCRQQKEKEQHLQQEAVLRGGLISALNVQQLQLLEDRDALEDEKTKMAASHLSGSDVLKLNVRGTYFQTRRATLTQAEGSVLAIMFSGRWEEQLHVEDGHIFLDFIPYCFERIMDYLSSKAIEHPDRPVPQPALRAGSEADFETLVLYLGLQQYMGYKRLIPRLSARISGTMLRL